MATVTHIIDKNYPVYATGNQTISGVKNFTNNLVIQDNLLQSSQASGYLTGVGYSGNYDGGYFLGATKLSQNTSRLIDSSFGNTWIAKESSRNWRSISISSDGKYQNAVVFNGQIYVSSDYGDSWTSKENTRNWQNIAISKDGKYQTAVGLSFQIYTSNDYGNTWIPKDISRSWQCVAINSDGKYQIIGTQNDFIYISSDYGNTWTAKGLNKTWLGISISSDGKYQSAIAASDKIYISSDYGNTWTAKESNRTWSSISISSDGKYQTATHQNGFIYISSDYGNTWTAKGLSGSWLGISISSDGKYQSAVNSANGIYISTDYGNNWILKNTLTSFRRIAINSNGKYQTAIIDGGQIYTSKTDELIDGNLYADNLVYNTGIQNISGAKTFLDSGIFSLSGASPLSLPTNPLAIVGSGNTYIQVNIQNRATGTTATADLVITANNGTDTSNYINLGINNSGYSDPAFSNGSGLDGYLIVNGGSLDIATTPTNSAIEFHVGGTTADKLIARIDNSGINITSGTYRVNNTGVLLSGQNSFLITLYNTSDTQASGHNYFGNIAAAFSQTAGGVNRRFPILESCIVKKATWTQFNQTVGNPSQNSTGYFINTTTNITGIISTTINTQNTNTPTHYIVDFSPPITISTGDYIVCSLFGPGYATTYPATVRNTVNLYCYN